MKLGCISRYMCAFSICRLSYVAELVEHYYTPLLCCVGAIGNCLSLAVFCFNANQRNLSSSYYLSALAISDTGFLITVFVFWLETFGPGVLSSKLGCPFIMYSGQVTCFLSVWLTGKWNSKIEFKKQALYYCLHKTKFLQYFHVYALSLLLSFIHHRAVLCCHAST